MYCKDEKKVRGKKIKQPKSTSVEARIRSNPYGDKTEKGRKKRKKSSTK